MNTLQKLDMVRKAQMQAKIVHNYVTFGAFFLAFLFIHINTAFGQVPGYSYKVKITIDGSQVCGASSLINFPILIQHTAPFLRPAPTGLVSSANGYDVVFTASDGTTLLNHQLDHYTYDASNGTYSAWVNMPSLPPGSNTDIYMYYGNASITTDQSSTGTWDSNFRTVYHFQSNNLNDGTANSINGVNNGTSDAGTAHIGGGRNFDGINDYIQTTSNDLATANNFTLSAWFKTNITNPSHIMWQGMTNENGWGDGLIGPQGQELNLSIGTCCTSIPNYVSVFLGHTEEQLDANGLTAEIAFTNTTNWHYVVATMSNLNTSPIAHLYIDGALVDTDTGTPASIDRSLWDNTLRIGRPGANERYFNGQLDEIRVSNVSRSADWICTEYNNQNTPGNGLTFTNSPPVLAAIEPSTLNYTEEDPATIITSAITIADENDGFISGATIQITNNYNNGQDVLAFTNAFGITGSWNSGSGTLTLTGLTTLANYQNALRSVTYQNTNLDNPSTLTRTVSFIVNDGTANSNIVTRNISVIGVNDAPAAVDDTYTVDEDAPLNVAAAGVLTNDSDVDGNPITAVLVSTTSNGSLALNADGSFEYTPNANYNGSDSFTYRANDGTLSSGIATVTITITPVNDAPVAVDDAYTVDEDTPLNVAAAGVLTNDSDVDGNPIIAVLVSTTSNGSLTLNADGSFSYTPNANYNGSDSFTYRANDGTLNSAVATVTIAITPVNDAPVAVDDAYTVDEDTPLNVAAAGVLTNDSDVDGNPIIAVLVSTTTNGSLTLNADGSFDYTPNANYNGSDSFTYRASDGTLNSGVATVTITITPVNDAPVAVNDTYIVDEDTPLNIATPGVLSNDSDVDGNPMIAVLVSTTTNGSLTLNADGSFSYTPNANYNGSDSFTYRANDGTLNSAVATVTINITPVNDDPVAVDDTYTVDEDTPLNVAAAGILTNDSDVDGDPITAVLVNTTTNGSLTLNADGSFEYTPNANYNGSDSFTYQANDGTLNSGVATVTITITPVNDAPVAVDDTYTVDEDTPLNVAAAGVLSNDSDVDGDPITAVLVSTTSNGSLTLNADGSFEYTPNANYNGSDSFTYRANDGTVNSGVATVTITITPVNDAPVAVDDNASTLENSSVLINLLSNDYDEENNLDPATVTIIGNVSNGSLTINSSTGVATYTPANGFIGNDSFTYTINDTDGLTSNVATVTIVISPVNDPPVAINDGPIIYASGLPLTIDVLANDSDPDNTTDELTIISVTPPTFGKVTIENGVVVYEPSGTSSGTVTFTYTIQDPEGLTSTATVTIQYEYASLKISEGFSPNGDGRNDTWYIRSIESHPNNVVKVFDRWGLLVFETKQYDNASVVWDGRANTGTQSGSYLDQGTYYYIVNLGDRTKELSGYVMIVR